MTKSKIHSTAIIEPGAVIGSDVEIGAYCCIGSRVKIGNGVKLQSHVVVMEETELGDDVMVYPFASLGQKPQDLKYKGEKSRLLIGRGTVIREYVTASIGTAGGGMLTSVGENCLIMAYCHIAHDCLIGNDVIMVNGVNLAGHVVVGDGAIIGGMSAVKQFTRIGKYAMIGGCTGVDRDVIPYGVARSERTTKLKGLNIIGLRRHGFSNAEIEVMQDVYKVLFVAKATNRHDAIVKLREQYVGMRAVQEILDFMEVHSRNPVCTQIPTDI
ncbi:MAG: acyl-ACP--UDP-N-acetylglucosamine O-acyltransferase [Alphaproteobacteria bacterium]|nr:acyl-ACP--UDP-N-acetylglucosamine O-acyltransferase [Alphaproteobacteria bacterium]